MFRSVVFENNVWQDFAIVMNMFQATPLGDWRVEKTRMTFGELLTCVARHYRI
jgi:hypothetical protein